MDDGMRRLSEADAEAVARVVNESATAYDGTIPEDCYSEPYLSVGDLREEMRTTEFYGYEVGEGSTGRSEDASGRSGDATSSLAGVVGFRERDDASLIRRLYVHPEFRREGIGSRLLDFALGRVATDPILVGTWRDAEWAVAFYEKHGFTHLGTDRDLLRTYWDHPERRNEESVVLRYDG